MGCTRTCLCWSGTIVMATHSQFLHSHSVIVRLTHTRHNQHGSHCNQSHHLYVTHPPTLRRLHQLPGLYSTHIHSTDCNSLTVPAVVVAMVTTLTIALILIVAQLHKRSKKKGSLRVTRRYSDTHQVMVTAWKDTSNGGYSSKQQQSVSLAGLASRQHATPHSPCAPPIAPPPCQYSSRRTSLSNSLSTSSSRGTHSHRSSTSNSSNSTRTHYPPSSSRPRLTPDPTWPHPLYIHTCRHFIQSEYM